MYEYDHTVRHVFTDGRKHPKDAKRLAGHSIVIGNAKTL